MDDRAIDELAARAQRGDAASFEQLVAQLRAPLVAFLVRRLAVPDDADDVAQETFDRAYRSLASYDPSRRFATWLFAIGKHAAVNHRIAEQRRERRERAAGAEAEVAIEPAPADGAIWERARSVLRPDAYRALWLRYACDYTVREVARELGKSVVGVKVMLHRARGKLLEEDT